MSNISIPYPDLLEDPKLFNIQYQHALPRLDTTPNLLLRPSHNIACNSDEDFLKTLIVQIKPPVLSCPALEVVFDKVIDSLGNGIVQ